MVLRLFLEAADINLYWIMLIFPFILLDFASYNPAAYLWSYNDCFGDMSVEYLHSTAIDSYGNERGITYHVLCSFKVI
ncbi:unnamed protein product [Arabis nemorensis]|uniref:Uncharacterized protein n=1 Tax=Arabis nemorensis TaxID=586526 RepID=A0A565AQL2_9BRAS|nr:unnamed protein product [Arabis nemorensis]